MKWANKEYGEKDKEMISQLVIKSKDGQFGLLEKHLKDNELESKKSQMLIAKLKSTLGVLLTVISTISCLTVFLSLLVLVQYLQLILTKNSYEIRTMLRLGHSPEIISMVFIKYFVRLFAMIMTLSILVFIPSKLYLQKVFVANGISLDASVSYYLYIVAVLVFCLFAFSIWKSTRKRIVNSVNT